MNFKIFGILFVIVFSLNSCYFDTLENDNIVGNYWILTIDVPENRCLEYSDQEGGSFGEIVVPSTLLTVKWNNNYLVAGRHPTEGLKTECLNMIKSSVRKNEISNNNLKSSIELALDSLFNRKIDSLTNLEFERRLKGELSFLNEPDRQQKLIWYLFDLNNRENNKTFLTKDSLDSYLNRIGITHFENKRI